MRDSGLRIYNRFDALGVQATVAPALRLLMVSIAWALDAPMPVFIIAWGSAFAMGHIYLMVRGLKELKAHMDISLWSGFRWQEIRGRRREFWKFVGVVYWQTNIDLLPKHVSTLLAGRKTAKKLRIPGRKHWRKRPFSRVRYESSHRVHENSW